MATQTSVKSNENGKMDDISMSEAIAQFKEATSSIYDAVGSIGTATAANAKIKLNEGKARAIELEEKAEEAVRAKPLVTVGVAFAAGCLVSYLLTRRH
ncbi:MULTISPECIES: DUF883 C-terminal domain-containing protein [unclassified Cellvibrio]|jgi:ElaB/YqjD/DUF883 family membrane-anchored ribosome-binding protein|uniref:DUF883 C-terminal domain-containing protein n=1 Tax=unclassified Cellvibrio TaxID=2624793 RepID=UPI0002F188E2|nr:MULTISPECIES: DUF883 C-terminal domain-containing protein [unclassified Cellvibrio]QEY13350.1 hypothetical protein D0B88_14505 [Cellvibrio sp. KY-YJ-3]UUA73309.1 hypothetical protein NNX04_02385 [Cellvibrio sp. QJXJ]